MQKIFSDLEERFGTFRPFVHVSERAILLTATNELFTPINTLLAPLGLLNPELLTSAEWANFAVSVESAKEYKDDVLGEFACVYYDLPPPSAPSSAPSAPSSLSARHHAAKALVRGNYWGNGRAIVKQILIENNFALRLMNSEFEIATEMLQQSLAAAMAWAFAEVVVNDVVLTCKQIPRFALPFQSSTKAIFFKGDYLRSFEKYAEIPPSIWRDGYTLYSLFDWQNLKFTLPDIPLSEAREATRWKNLLLLVKDASQLVCAFGYEYNELNPDITRYIRRTRGTPIQCLFLGGTALAYENPERIFDCMLWAAHSAIKSRVVLGEVQTSTFSLDQTPPRSYASVVELCLNPSKQVSTSVYEFLRSTNHDPILISQRTPESYQNKALQPFVFPVRVSGEERKIKGRFVDKTRAYLFGIHRRYPKAQKKFTKFLSYFNAFIANPFSVTQVDAKLKNLDGTLSDIKYISIPNLQTPTFSRGSAISAWDSANEVVQLLETRQDYSNANFFVFCFSATEKQLLGLVSGKLEQKETPGAFSLHMQYWLSSLDSQPDNVRQMLHEMMYIATREVYPAKKDIGRYRVVFLNGAEIQWPKELEDAIITVSLRPEHVSALVELDFKDQKIVTEQDKKQKFEMDKRTSSFSALFDVYDDEQKQKLLFGLAQSFKDSPTKFVYEEKFMLQTDKDNPLPEISKTRSMISVRDTKAFFSSVRLWNYVNSATLDKNDKTFMLSFLLELLYLCISTDGSGVQDHTLLEAFHKIYDTLSRINTRRDFSPVLFENFYSLLGPKFKDLRIFGSPDRMGTWTLLPYSEGKLFGDCKGLIPKQLIRSCLKNVGRTYPDAQLRHKLVIVDFNTAFDEKARVFTFFQRLLAFSNHRDDSLMLDESETVRLFDYSTDTKWDMSNTVVAFVYKMKFDKDLGAETKKNAFVTAFAFFKVKRDETHTSPEGLLKVFTGTSAFFKSIDSTFDSRSKDSSLSIGWLLNSVSWYFNDLKIAERAEPVAWNLPSFALPLQCNYTFLRIDLPLRQNRLIKQTVIGSRTCMIFANILDLPETVCPSSLVSNFSPQPTVYLLGREIAYKKSASETEYKHSLETQAAFLVGKIRLKTLDYTEEEVEAVVCSFLGGRSAETNVFKVVEMFVLAYFEITKSQYVTWVTNRGREISNAILLLDEQVQDKKVRNAYGLEEWRKSYVAPVRGFSALITYTQDISRLNRDTGMSRIPQMIPDDDLGEDESALLLQGYPNRSLVNFVSQYNAFLIALFVAMVCPISILTLVYGTIDLRHGRSRECPRDSLTLSVEFPVWMIVNGSVGLLWLLLFLISTRLKKWGLWLLHFVVCLFVIAWSGVGASLYQQHTSHYLQHGCKVSDVSKIALSAVVLNFVSIGVMAAVDFGKW